MMMVSKGRDFAVKDPNLMPKNNVQAVPHGPDGFELHLSSSNTGYRHTEALPISPMLTGLVEAKPFRVKFGGHNIIGFYATALEGAVAYRGSAEAMPKPAGRTPDAAVAESSTGRRAQVWNSDVGEFVDARTGAVWKLDAKQQARQEAPVRLRSEREATSSVTAMRMDGDGGNKHHEASLAVLLAVYSPLL